MLISMSCTFLTLPDHTSNLDRKLQKLLVKYSKEYRIKERFQLVWYEMKRRYNSYLLYKRLLPKERSQPRARIRYIYRLLLARKVRNYVRTLMH